MKQVSFLPLATLIATASLSPPLAGEHEQTRFTSSQQNGLAWADWQPASLQIAQRIDEAIHTDHQLSVSAEHVKVLSINDTITLAGWVDNEGERAELESRAKQIAEGAPLECAISVR